MLEILTDLLDARYFIGRLTPLHLDTLSSRAEQTEALPHAQEFLCKADDGQSNPRLDTQYSDGGWTLRQVVRHLGDSHVNAIIRFNAALNEDWLSGKAYEQGAWARRVDSFRPIEGLLFMFGAPLGRWASRFQSMTGEDFQESFNHPMIGSQTLAASLALHSWLASHHAARITALRLRKGW